MVFLMNGYNIERKIWKEHGNILKLCVRDKWIDRVAFVQSAKDKSAKETELWWAVKTAQAIPFENKNHSLNLNYDHKIKVCNLSKHNK